MQPGIENSRRVRMPDPRPGHVGSFDLEGARTRWDEIDDATPSEVRVLGAELAEWVEAFFVGLDRTREAGFDPVSALRAARCIGDIERVFTRIGDRHTFVSYRRPPCPAGPDDAFDTVGTLQLPVRIGSAFAAHPAVGRERFWITDVVALEGLPNEALPRRGDEVTHWNGVPLDHVVRRLGAELRGAHGRAQRRIGLRALTRRVVEAGRLPEEDWVVLTTRRSGRPLDHRLDWSQGLFQWRSGPPSEEASEDGDRVQIGHFGEPTEIEGLLHRLREQRLSGRPLVLDLRGNAGGSVHGMLAVFDAVTGRPGSERLRFQFRASKRLQQDLPRTSRWRRWSQPSRDGFLAPHGIGEDGAAVASGRSITGTRRAPDVALGRVEGPVGVLVDASTFSAAEILTAMLRSDGALVFGTDPCTGGGPDNGWSVAALRRLCPEEWIGCRDAQDPEEALRSHCEEQGLRVGASWTEMGMRRWRLSADGAPDRSPRLAVWGPGPGCEAIAVYAMAGSLGSAMGYDVDLHLAVRRALVDVEGEWVPVGRQAVDHVLRPTRRDLLSHDRELLETAFHLLAGGTRVACSGAETPASSDVRSDGDQTEETTP